MKLGAPANLDALTRLNKWLSADSRSDLRKTPVLCEMLSANDSTAEDHWLYNLGEYRNKFTHRQPLGGQGGARLLQYHEREDNGIQFPYIELPLGDDDHSAPGCDALMRPVRG